MDHYNKIDITFTSSIPGKRFNIELWTGAIKKLTLFTNVLAGSYSYNLGDSGIDDGYHTIRVVSVSNSDDYKENQVIIHKKLRVHSVYARCRVGSKL